MAMEGDSNDNIPDVPMIITSQNQLSSTTVDQARLKADQAVHMIFQNKVNAKNAFDLDTDFVPNISLLVGESQAKHNESSWLRASASLDASAKIFGFRVDQVHQETYKVLSGLHR